MKRNFKLLVAMLVLAAMVLTFASCELFKHDHEYSADWSSDETNHWHASVCDKNDECSTATADLAAHTIVDGACSVCGYKASDDPDHTHTFVDGKCECGEEDPNYTPPECTEHQYGAPVVSKEATCTEEGEKTLTCTVCDYSYTQPVAPNGHTEVTVEGKAPTCTEAGLSNGKQCSVCLEITKAQSEISATGHNYVEGVCSGCGDVDPEYNGPKTYVLDVQTLTAFAAGAKADGDTELVADFFTIYYSAKTKIDTTKNKTWPDGYTFAEGLRLNWGGTTSIGETTKNAIEIVVDGTATVKVWWICGGDGREIGIFNENGELVVASQTDDVFAEGTEGVGAGKNGVYLSELSLSEAGKYYIGTDNTNAIKNGGNIICKVEVVVTPAEEAPAQEIKVTTHNAYGFNDMAEPAVVDSFTADKAGYYTFTLPAGLGLWSKKSLDSNPWGSPDVDFMNNTSGGTYTVALKAGEVFEFYVGAITEADWVITWSVVEGEVGGGDGDGDGDGDQVTDIGGTYTGHSAYNDNITVVINSSLGLVTFTQGSNTISALYEIVDGAVVLYKNDGSGEEWNSMFYAITLGSNGAPETAVYNGNTFTLLTGSGDGDGDGDGDDTTDSDLAVGPNSIEVTDEIISNGGVDYTLVVVAEGTYSFKGDFFVNIYNANGDKLGTGSAYLEAGTYSVNLSTMLISNAGTYVLTIEYQAPVSEVEPDGSETNPYPIESDESSVTVPGNASSMVYYTFTATADGSVIVTYPTANSWIFFTDKTDGSNNTSSLSKDVNSFTLIAGHEYVIGLGTWETEESDPTVSVSIVACEHSWSEATCYALSTCSKCGATTGDYAEHIPNIDNPTCANPAVCTVCGNETGYIPHSMEETYVYATCTIDGSYYGVCTVCGYEESEVLLAQGHYNYLLACGESGECVECGETMTKEHNLSWYPATCTEAAVCWDCSSSVGEPLGHSYDETGLCSACGETRKLVVAGSEAFFGSNWSLEDENNLLTYVEGVFTKTYESTSKGIYDFKVIDVTAAYNWDVAYPSENYKFYVEVGSKVVITVDVKTGALTVEVYAPGSETATDGTTYMVVGDNELCGDVNTEDGDWGWETGNYDNLLTLNADGKYELVYTGVAAGSYGIKVVKNGDYGAGEWSDNGQNYTITVDADNSIVTILFDLESGTISHTVHAHSYESVVTATCTEAGTATYTCECGDTYTVDVEALGHNYVDYVCSVCATDDPDHYFVMSIADALAAADGKKVEVSGTVSVAGAWNSSFGNMNVTIVDADGNELYIYRLATEVALGDIITVKGTMATYNSSRQIAQGATAVITGHDTSYDVIEEYTIPEAIAAADGTNVKVTGTVVKINAAWSSSYNNMNVTIADEEGNQLYIYRLATQVALNDIITVTGAMGTYSGSRQIAEGSTAEIIGTHTCSNYTEATCTKLSACVVCGATIGELAAHNYVDDTCSVCGAVEGVVIYTESLAIAASAGTLADDSLTISWASDNCTVVNAKASSTNAIRTSDSDHFRAYKGSETTISGKNITKVVITCTGADYATVCAGSLSTTGVTATVDGSVVTLTVDSGTVDSIVIAATAQWRFNNVEVTYQ